MRIYIDVSEWQGDIDWDTVTGVDGVMIRAGAGKRLDDKWERNIAACNRLGIPAGAYWFSYAKSEEEAKQEARALLAAVEGREMELPLAFDFEYDSVSNMANAGIDATKELVSSITRAFCSTVEGAGYYALVYTNKDFSGRYLEDNILVKYDLWLADWKTLSDAAKPYRSCGLWQHGTTTVSGITGAVDANVAYKDYPAVIREAGLNRLSGDAVTAFAVEMGLTADGSDKADTVAKYDLWTALYKIYKKGE